MADHRRSERSSSTGGSGEGPERLVVGVVRRAHGIRGEVLVEPLTAQEVELFAPGRELWAAVAGGEDEETRVLTIQTVRRHKGGLLLGFEAVDDRTAAEALAGADLLAPAADLAPLEPDEVFYHELVGMEVVLASGERVGTVRQVFEARPADLLEVRMAERVVLIPFSRQVVSALDRERRRIVIDPPEGLLDMGG